MCAIVSRNWVVSLGHIMWETVTEFFYHIIRYSNVCNSVKKLGGIFRPYYVGNSDRILLP